MEGSAIEQVAEDGVHESKKGEQEAYVMVGEKPPDRQQKYEGVKWIHLLRDLQSALYQWRRGQLTIREWWKSIRGRKGYAVFSWSDPLPFVAALYKAIPLMLSPRERGRDNY